MRQNSNTFSAESHEGEIEILRHEVYPLSVGAALSVIHIKQSLREKGGESLFEDLEVVLTNVWLKDANDWKIVNGHQSYKTEENSDAG